ncbi:flavin reductase family protein [Ammoniphilus sp. YIM 78166]|uniref:flavin reductase family protein n=1 Tax=Ammoniphilus sp. YIM 78166 TaxID=1644106 RepID=UPI0010704297|nr:flavin reductase family protein [Ammoniphilus sp. YIM 78166]
MKVEPSSLEWKDAYKLLIGSILPRPIAFVSTLSKDGAANLAPFSFFTGICADPFLVCFAPMRKGTDGEKKDTLRNIEETKEFVINIVGEKIVNEMNDCSVDYPPDTDEFEKVKLSKISSDIVLPPRVKESDVQLECVLREVLHFGEHPGSGSLVIGQVVMVHVQDQLYREGRINTEMLQPIGRLAGQSYTRAAADTFVLERRKQLS